MNVHDESYELAKKLLEGADDGADYDKLYDDIERLADRLTEVAMEFMVASGYELAD